MKKYFTIFHKELDPMTSKWKTFHGQGQASKIKLE